MKSDSDPDFIFETERRQFGSQGVETWYLIGFVYVPLTRMFCLLGYAFCFIMQKDLLLTW
jgi:hypothetical protein